VPLSGLRLTEFILGHAAEADRKPAIIDGATGRAISYHDLAADITSAASGLVRHGVRRGDVIALVSPNCPEFAIAFHAAVLAGAAVSPVNPLAPAAEMARQLTHSGAQRMIAAGPVFEETGRTAAASAGIDPGSVFVFGEAPGALPFASLSLGRLLGIADDEESAAQWLVDTFRIKLVCITRGARGSLLVSEYAKHEHSGIRVQVADTVGAGDAFTAALVYHYLRRDSLATMNEAANRMGSWVASQTGATPAPDEARLQSIRSASE